jgi:carbon-monoxide dehydrogenase medium subunit
MIEEKEDAKILAGGQSLLAMMKLRLLTPGALVDIGKVPGLDYVREEGDHVAIGALATHQIIHESEIIKSKCPLLSDAAGRIGDVQIRNRGTIGGSISHADPAADYPPALLALGGKVFIWGKDGGRVVDAEDFFLDVFTTALKPAELVREVRVPLARAHEGHAYIKFIKRESEFATVSVAVRLVLDRVRQVEEVRVALGAMANKAIRALAVEDRLRGKRISEELIEEASNVADEGTSPPTDVHASAEYRRHLAKVLTKRALLQALSESEGRR